MIAAYVVQDLAEVKQIMLHYTAFKPMDKGWSVVEQERFWEALVHFPQGPWTSIAGYIGTKTTRQAMTHAQKLRQKLERWKKKHTTMQTAALVGEAARQRDSIQSASSEPLMPTTSNLVKTEEPATPEPVTRKPLRSQVSLEWLFEPPLPCAKLLAAPNMMSMGCDSPRKAMEMQERYYDMAPPLSWSHPGHFELPYDSVLRTEGAIV